MVPEFVERIGGSEWVQAQPARRTNFGGGLGEREAKRSLPQPARVGSADMSFSGKSRKNGEFGNFNLWFPNSSIDPAAASGCRLSLPGGRKNAGGREIIIDN